MFRALLLHTVPLNTNHRIVISVYFKLNLKELFIGICIIKRKLDALNVYVFRNLETNDISKYLKYVPV